MANSGAGEVKPHVFYGGPYLGESAKIEAELLRHHNAGTKPTKNDFLKLFLEDGISEGGLGLIDTHVDGHPNAGYGGERYYETIEAHGVPVVEKPSEDYVFPADGGTNIEDDYPSEPLGNTEALSESVQEDTETVQESEEKTEPTPAEPQPTAEEKVKPLETLPVERVIDDLAQ